MTRNEAVKLILMRCGMRHEDEELQAACILEMALAQKNKLELAEFKPWFLLSEFLRANTGANEPRMPVPTGFLAEHEDGILWILPEGATEYKRLHKDDNDTLEEYYLGYVARLPERYSLVRDYFILRPIPDKAYPLKVRCFLREPLLTYPYADEAAQAVKTNRWLEYAADWLIGEVGAVIAGQYIKDQETAAIFAKEAEEGKNRVYVEDVSREENNRVRSAGDD